MFTFFDFVHIGVEFVFTPWGLVSGLLWIPGGSAGIYAVRTNGIAISVGIWSCISVLVSTYIKAHKKLI